MLFSREAFAIGSDTVSTLSFKDGMLMELVLKCLNSDQKHLFTSWVSDESVGVIVNIFNVLPICCS